MTSYVASWAGSKAHIGNNAIQSSICLAAFIFLDLQFDNAGNLCSSGNHGKSADLLSTCIFVAHAML